MTRLVLSSAPIALFVVVACTPVGSDRGPASSSTAAVTTISVGAAMSASATAATSDDTATDKAIAARIEASQRAGLVNHDADAYLEPWAPDAKLVGGRGPEPGANDLVLSRKQNEAVKRYRFASPAPDDLQLTMRDTEVRIEGQRAILTWTATTSGSGWQEVVGERYELCFPARGWRGWRR